MFDQHPAPSPAGNNVNTMPEENNNGINNNNGNNNNVIEEPFTNFKWNGVQLDLILKALFFGAIFYLLSLPEVYKLTKKCCKKVDGPLLHAMVFTVLYFILSHFI